MSDKLATNPSRVGVIDIGTNTFHLLIAEQDAQGDLRILHREKQFVKLAEGGIGRIQATAFVRAMNTLGRFSQRLKEWQVTTVKAMGTEGLRKAANGADFIATAAQQTGIQINVISGEAEADYIWRGVTQSIPMGDHPHLIMDIGGGSVEFIIGDAQQIMWRKSYPIGVAVLRQQFHQQEPISTAERSQLVRFLDDMLPELIDQCQTHQVASLIGASGTFDVVNAQLSGEGEESIDLARFERWQAQLAALTLDQRLADPSIPNNRADMIVVALLLIQFILDRCPIRSLQVSPYAMKEGILFSAFAE